MTLSYEDLERIKEFGNNGVACDDIINQLQIKDAKEFKDEFENPDSIIYVAYNAAVPKSVDRLNNELTRKAGIESNILEIKLDNFRKRIEMRKQLFGV